MKVECPICLRFHDINEALAEIAELIRKQGKEIARLNGEC